jgi:glutamyl-tRNA synthetase
VSTTGAGRFAPSPSGPLHVGNLRTALLAWLFARSSGRACLCRVEDLDERSRPQHEAAQLAELAAIGLEFDGAVVRQTSRRAAYDAVIDRLGQRGLTYPCWCTRREIQDAPRAPHTPPGAYPGTCRDLPAEEVARRLADPGWRRPAWRLRTHGETVRVHDRLRGPYEGVVDDMVLRRGDGTPAYNLAVVVDDAWQGVDQVVRGDDLLSSAPRQAYLAELLVRPAPQWVHVPLALNEDGARLAKRDGAVTLEALAEAGFGPGRVLAAIGASLGLATAGERGVTPERLLGRFDPDALPREPWVVDRAGRWLEGTP